MDYKELVLKSLRLTWGHKWLWVFGLFVGGAGGFNTGGLNFNGSGSMEPFSDPGQNIRWQAFSHAASDWISRNLVLIIALAVVLFLLFLFFACLGLISQGALIGAADDLDKDEETRFSKALGVGLANFWRIFGFLLLLTLIALAPLSVLGIFAVFVFLTGGAALFFLILLIPGFLLLIPLFIALGLVANLGARAVVIENQGPTGAFKAGWRMMRSNLGPVLLTWLISIVIGFAFGIAFLILIVALIVPTALAGYLIFRTGFSLAKLGIIAFLTLLLFIVFGIIRSFIGAYNSVYWTLAFRQIRALENPEPKPQSDGAG